MRLVSRYMRVIITRAAAFPFILILLFPAIGVCDEDFGQTHGPRGKKGASAIVYVIDKSTSMSWIFDDLKQTLKKAVDESRPEDGITIILCGDTVTTLARYKTMDEAKKRRLAELIDSVSPDALHTNLAPSIRRAAEYLYDYARDDAADSYNLILVTDGKDHPSPDAPRDFSIEDALTQHSSFLPGEQWTLRYIALKGSIDPQLLALVRKYGGGIFDVEKISREFSLSEGQIVKSLIEDPDAWGAFEAEIVDCAGEVKVKSRHGKIWETIREGEGRRLNIDDLVATAGDSRAIIRFGTIGRVGLEDNTEVLLDDFRRSPARRLTIVRLVLEGGAVWNAVGVPPNSTVDYSVTTPTAITSIRGTIFRVAFNRETRATCSAVLSGAAEVSPFGTKFGFESQTLRSNTYTIITPGVQSARPSAIIQEEPSIAPLHETITMGPISANGAYSVECPIVFSQKHHEILFEWNRWKQILMEGSSLSEVDFEEAGITAETAIDLPLGANLKVRLLDSTDRGAPKKLVISIDCAASFKHRSHEDYLGGIELTGADSVIKLARDYIDLRVVNPSPRIPLLHVLIGATITVVGILLVWLVFKKSKRAQELKRKVLNYIRDKAVKTKLIRPFRARPSGKLITRKGSRSAGPQTFDLSEISRGSDKIVLDVGSDPTNSITLPHSSIQPHHCTIWASRKRFSTRIYIQADPEARILVNGEPVTGPRQLQDKDMVGIGAYRFEFIDTQFHRQVEVHMNDGTVHEGMLEYWDVSQSVFYMTVIARVEQNFLNLSFVDMAYVHFFRDESEREVRVFSSAPSEAKRKKAVTVTLLNKKKLKGFVHRKYRLDRSLPGVFLLPLSPESKIQHTYIPRTSIKSIVMVDVKEPAVRD